VEEHLFEALLVRDVPKLPERMSLVRGDNV
jgi:hypothetical protein